MRFLNMFRPAEDLIDQNGPCSFYCSDCDSNVVKADDYKTGCFFVSSGHKLIANSNHKCFVSDAYIPIVFALCNECLDKTGFREIMARHCNWDGTELPFPWEKDQ
jgi:hypothetical protein